MELFIILGFIICLMGKADTNKKYKEARAKFEATDHNQAIINLL